MSEFLDFNIESTAEGHVRMILISYEKVGH